jgi:hypothetical protein
MLSKMKPNFVTFGRQNIQKPRGGLSYFYQPDVKKLVAMPETMAQAPDLGPDKWFEKH